MITAILFVLVPFLKRAPHIIIHLAMNVEKGGGVLMRITLPNLKHSFICPVPVPVPIPDFRVFHTPVKIGLEAGDFSLICSISQEFFLCDIYPCFYHDNCINLGLGLFSFFLYDSCDLFL